MMRPGVIQGTELTIGVVLLDKPPLEIVDRGQQL